MVLTLGSSPKGCAPPSHARSRSYFVKISHLEKKMGLNPPPTRPLTRFGPFFGPLMIPSPQGPLTKKEATNNVYLDTQVMGSNPGIRSQSSRKVPNPTWTLLPCYNYTRNSSLVVGWRMSFPYCRYTQLEEFVDRHLSARHRFGEWP